MSHEPTDPNPKSQTVLEERLVAYLDGELDGEEGRRIEQLLAADPKVRETLGRLEGTWDLLDSLGREDMDDTFTQSTMEMAVVAAVADLDKEQADVPSRQRRRLILGGGCLAAAAVVGFFAVAFFSPNPNRQLLEDMPMLRELDQYRQIDDVDFLKGMLEADLFPEEVEDGP